MEKNNSKQTKEIAPIKTVSANSESKPKTVSLSGKKAGSNQTTSKTPPVKTAQKTSSNAQVKTSAPENAKKDSGKNGGNLKNYEQVKLDLHDLTVENNATEKPISEQKTNGNANGGEIKTQRKTKRSDKKTSKPKNAKSINVQNKKPRPNNVDPVEEYSKRLSSDLGERLVIDAVIKRQEDTKQSAQITKRQKVAKRVFYILFFAFVVGVLAFTFYNDFFSNTHKEVVSFQELLGILGMNWYYLVFALMSLGFCFLFKALKLSIMCKYMTGKFHFKTCFFTGILGHYYNYITPLAVGGQPFEIIHLSKHGVHGGVASSMPIAAFFINELAFVILTIVSLILYNSNVLSMPSSMQFLPGTITALSVIGLICCLGMPSLVIAFAFFPSMGASLINFFVRIGEKLHLVKNPRLTAYKAIKNVTHNSICLKKMTRSFTVTTLSLLFSFGEWFGLASVAYFVLRFFGFDLVDIGGFQEWGIIVGICFILYAAVSFIPTPGNSGAADLSFYLLFETGLNLAGAAFPAMIAWRLLSFYSFIIIGFFVSRYIKKADKRRNELESQSSYQPEDKTPVQETIKIEIEKEQ